MCSLFRALSLCARSLISSAFCSIWFASACVHCHDASWSFPGALFEFFRQGLVVLRSGSISLCRLCSSLCLIDFSFQLLPCLPSSCYPCFHRTRFFVELFVYLSLNTLLSFAYFVSVLPGRRRLLAPSWSLLFYFRYVCVSPGFFFGCFRAHFRLFLVFVGGRLVSWPSFCPSVHSEFPCERCPVRCCSIQSVVRSNLNRIF